MSTYTVELQAKTDKAVQEIEELKKEIEKLNKTVKEGNDKTDKSFKSVEKSTKKVAKGIGFIGKSLKAAGIGLAITAFAKLTEVFNENQKATNFFNTTFEALSLAFNDFFNFLDANVGVVIDYFKGIFDDPVQSIKNLGVAITENLIERFRSALDSIGYLGKALVKVFEGDFAGAVASVKDAAKESVDIFTGVNNTFEKAAETLPSVVNGIKEYTKSTIQAAQETVELNREAEIGIAQNRIILEQKDREAEKLRQIRDDESKTIEQRIQANNDLAAVLDEQERLMRANADAVIAAAQAQYDKNKNDENQIALLEAKAEKEGILAQIEGFRSEQLMNINSLQREQQDLLDEAEELRLEEKERRAEREIEIDKMVADAKKSAVDQAINLFGAETTAGKIALVAKQALAAKEMIMEAKKTITFATLATAKSGAAVAEGSAQTAKVGFPQNVPLLIAYGLQAAGIISAVASAVGKAKSAAASAGGSFGGGASAGGASAAPQAPSFNVVGASPTSQLAESISEREDKPIKAFVVSDEVSNQQALDRRIIGAASFG